MQKSFDQFLVSSGDSISVSVLIVNLLLAALLSVITGAFYIKFGTSQSNRRSFALVFLLIAVTTTLVITVVKSSLALSLGLVGALSIVRFRAAIKEPEELAFLFMVISIGLGLGAGQQLITVVALSISMVCFVMYRKLFRRRVAEQNFFLTVRSEGDVFTAFPDLEKLLISFTSLALLKRSERSGAGTTAVFYIEFADKDSCIGLQQSLQDFEPHLDWTLVEDIRVI